ncbi:MAG: peptidoglycan editing factor PgeF [Ignavibacteriae bacterium]|nr:peptidoglycan editing factor PgeF [Ignavibacteriota bacterium]
MNNNNSKLKIIKSEMFSRFPELKFGISTRHYAGAVPPFYFNLSYNVGDKSENVRKHRTTFFRELGIEEDRVSFQRQTHSVLSHNVTEPKFFEDSDALYTNTKNTFLAISIADCIPVFLYEPSKKITTGIHSGWKGTLNKITTVTVEKLKNEFSVNPGNIFAFIGPGISSEHFEVGKDVYDLFENDVKEIRSGKYFIDLKLNNYKQLIKLGVKPENIEVSEYCTFKNEKLFHSYRRDRDNSGRMIGVIGLI